MPGDVGAELAAFTEADVLAVAGEVCGGGAGVGAGSAQVIPKARGARRLRVIR